MKPLIIKEMNGEDQPRQKLQIIGPSSLSDAELLAIILRTGSREMTAIGLAQSILKHCGGSLSHLARCSINDLTAIKGVGPAKAVEIIAAIEIGKRKISQTHQEAESIRSSKDAYWTVAAQLMDLNIEEFWVVICNRANKVMDKWKLSAGAMDGTVVDVKVLMKYALNKNASGILIAHNHPSGNLCPSEEDRLLTKKISEAAQLLDIRLLDHIIVAGNKYTSFADEGWL